MGDCSPLHVAPLSRHIPLLRSGLRGSQQRKGTSSKARYLIIHDNKLLIRLPEADSCSDSYIDLNRTKADTPAEIVLPYRRDLPLHEAVRYLEGTLPAIEGARVRFLYSNSEWNADCNLFHFIVAASTTAPWQKP